MIGLTGGLASGKSTVLSLFQKLGVDTFSADSIVHQLLNHHKKTQKIIIEHFGNDILTQKNEINRTKLRNIIFNSKEEKAWLENCLHPRVRERLKRACAQSISPYVIVEIPLLAESKTPFEWINRILVVDADEEIQQYRAQNRSQLSNDEVHQILKQQTTRQKRNAIADDLITNDNDLAHLEMQVMQLHRNYIERSRF